MAYPSRLPDPGLTWADEVPPPPGDRASLADVVAWREAIGDAIDRMDLRVRRARRLGVDVDLSALHSALLASRTGTERIVAQRSGSSRGHPASTEADAILSLVRDKIDAMLRWVETERERPSPNWDAATEGFRVWSEALQEVFPIAPLSDSQLEVQDDGGEGIFIVIPVHLREPRTAAEKSSGLIEVRRRVRRAAPEASDLFAVRFRDADADRAA